MKKLFVGSCVLLAVQALNAGDAKLPVTLAAVPSAVEVPYTLRFAPISEERWAAIIARNRDALEKRRDRLIALPA